MGKRKALGRGLDALLPTTMAGMLSGEEIVYIPVGEIVPNPDQPRVDFDEDSLKSLARSIESQGVIQPILVRKEEGGFILVAGERRLRAAKLAGIPRIPAIVITESDPAVLFYFSLVENLQRENLNPIEEALAYNHLIGEFGLTQDEIATGVGKSRPAVANALRLLTLPGPVLDMLRSGQLSAGHGRAILAAGDEARMIRLARLASTRGLSVERLEIIAREDRPSPRHSKSRRGKRTRLPAELAALQDELTSHLATKVRIGLSDKGGTITIDFYSDEDLKRITEILSGE